MSLPGAGGEPGLTDERRAPALRKGHAYGTAGFEGALANLNAANQATRLVSDWIAAKDRADSRRYLDDHQEGLHSQEVTALLADAGTPGRLGAGFRGGRMPRLRVRSPG